MIGQDQFGTALLDPKRPTPQGVVNPDGTPAGKRFDVYRNNVAVSLTEALMTAFPTILKLVGEDFFRAMAGVFLRQHPPRSPLMMFYGAEMPDFLAGFPPVSHLPYLADVARIDLALRRAYHAADATPLDPDALARIPEDALPDVAFGFAPAVQIVVSDHPVHGIWAANALGGPAPVPGPEAALVTRPEFDPMVDPLTHAQAAVCRALMAGTALGLSLADAGPGFDLGPLLALLLQRRALTTLTTKE